MFGQRSFDLLAVGRQPAQPVLLDLVPGRVAPFERQQVAMQGVGSLRVETRVALEVLLVQRVGSVGFERQRCLDSRTVGGRQHAPVRSPVIERRLGVVDVRLESPGLLLRAPARRIPAARSQRYGRSGQNHYFSVFHCLTKCYLHISRSSAMNRCANASASSVERASV